MAVNLRVVAVEEPYGSCPRKWYVLAETNALALFIAARHPRRDRLVVN